MHYLRIARTKFNRRIHLSSRKLVGTMRYSYGIVPEAGTEKAFNISKTTSGVPIRHPSVNSTGCGASFGSPSRVPLLLHATRSSRRGERAVVREFSGVRIGKPRRHLFG